MPLHVSNTCAHHQEVKIALHSLWYHHTETSEWSKITKKFCFTISLFHASTCFEHMCSKHVEAWNKLIVKQKFCASNWLITEINILSCTVSKTSKFEINYVCRVHRVAAVLYLQFMLLVMLFPMLNMFCTFTLALPTVSVQCTIWLFSAVR